MTQFENNSLSTLETHFQNGKRAEKERERKNRTERGHEKETLVAFLGRFARIIEQRHRRQSEHERYHVRQRS